MRGNYRVFGFLGLMLLLGGAGYSRGRVEMNLASQPYLDKKLQLHVELDLLNRTAMPVSDVRVYFRSFGETQFRSHSLRPEGLRYLASVDLSGYAGEVVEYFFAVEYADGTLAQYPESAPEYNLYEISVNQSFDSGDGLVVITPEPNDIIYTDEFLLTVSFFEFSSRVDKERIKVHLDEYDISRSQYLAVYDDFITFSPKRITPGQHTLRVELFDRSGRLLAMKEWAFRAISRTGPSRVTPEFQVSGNFFAEARTENLVDGRSEEQYNKAGLRVQGGNTAVEFGTRLYVSNREDQRIQPINRYTGWVQGNFWNGRYLRVTGGDAYPQMNPYLLQNIYLRGIHTELFLKFLNLEFATGQARRDVEGAGVVNGNAVQVTAPGTFQRNIWGARASFGERTHFQFGLTAVKGKDDPNSIRFGRRPEETAAGGVDLFLATPNRRFILEGSVNLSSYNPDIIDGKDVSRQQLLDIGVDIDQDLYDFATGIITVNQNLIVLPGVAYQGTARLNVLNNNLAVTYKRVEPEFRSLGQPFLLRDIKGIFISDNIRLFQNQLFLNLRYQQYENNLGDVKKATTDTRLMSVNFSYFPLTRLPSLTFGFSNYRRDNGLVSIGSALAAPEDNSTNTIQFSSNYGFLFSGLQNNLTLNILNYDRQDETDFKSNNLSNTVSLTLQTTYKVPLKTRLELIFQQSDNTSNFLEANQPTGFSNSSDLSLNAFGGGVEYQLPQFLSPQGGLLLAASGRYGKVETSTTTPFRDPGTNTLIELKQLSDYNRTFFNARIIYSDTRLGRISLNGDWINYTGGRDFRDYILTARYDISF